MLNIRIFFLLLVRSTLCNQGWVFDKQIKAESNVKHFLAISNNSLVVQTNSNVYLAPFNSPNVIEQIIVSNIQQNVAIPQWIYKQSYLYTIYNYLHYEESNSMIQVKVNQIDTLSCFLRIDELIYSYNPLVSPNLLIYNITNDSISYGPYLIAKDKKLFTMAIQMNPIFQHLIISIDCSIFFINLKTMTVINSYFNDLRSEQIQISISPQGKYVSHNIATAKNVYMFDQKLQQYTQIYQISWDNQVTFKFGFTFKEQTKQCIGVMTKKLQNAYFKYVLELDCSEPYDTILDKQDPVKYGIRYLGGQHMDILYTVGRQNLPTISIFKYKVAESGFNFISKQQIHFDLSTYIIQIYSISNKELFIFKDSQNPISIIQLSTSQWKCKKQIEQYDLLSQKIRQVLLSPSQKQLYVLFQHDRTILLWINLQTCQIKNIVIQIQIWQVYFMNGRTYIEIFTHYENFILLDQTSKKIQKKFTITTNPNINLNDVFFGVLFENNMFYVCRYDSQFKIIKKSQIRSQLGISYLKKGLNHLTAICGNQYHFYDLNLFYLGSSSISQTQAKCSFVEETYSRSLRVSLQNGKLHYNNFKEWKLIMEQEGNIIMPESSFCFKNESDAVSLGKDQSKFYLSHYKYFDNRFHALSRVCLEIKINQVYITSPSLRWSCGKKYILLKYCSILDSINIYINVYEAFTFRLVYSHRLDVKENSNRLALDQFNAYLDCNNILAISTYSKIDIVDLNKRKAILLDNFKVIYSVALSNNAQAAVILGEDTRNLNFIEVRSLLTSQITERFVSHSYDKESNAYLVNGSLYIISQNNLFQQTRKDSILLATSIVDCSYHGDKFLCLTLDGNIITVNNNSTNTFQLSNKQFDSSDQHIFIVNSTLIVYDRKDLAIYSSLEPFSLIQSISLKSSRIDGLTVSPDLKKMITFDRISKSFTFWNNQSCPSLSYLKNGKCECVQELVEGVCRCRQGHFDLQGQCTKCQFYCEQCGSSAGDCLMMSTAGILMIVGLALIVVFVGASIIYCRRKRTKKAKKTQALSQLLQQRSLIDQ